MAVRSFAGNASVIMLPGALNGVTPGPWTSAILWKRNMTGASPLVTIAANATDATTSFASKFWNFISANVANDPSAAFVNNTGTSTTAADIVNADGWVIEVVTKATGTATPRFHVRYLTAATTSRANGAGTLANGATLASTDRICFGKDEYFNRLNGNIATAGLWNVALSDAQVDELWANLKTADWFANSGGQPLALWDFNQESTATAVVDLTSGGADQTAITNTSVVTGDDPPGWTFGLTQPITGGPELRVVSSGMRW